MRKSQISFEFIIIFALIFFALIGFVYIINERLSELAEEKEYIVMKSLANSIINEVVLAASVSNNYMRKFEIPTRIEGEKYNISIIENELDIRLLEEGKLRKQYYATLPLPVKGTFINQINSSNTTHCITKNDYDGVRISWNQASIDSSSEIVSPGDRFEVFLALHCVENVLSIGFTINYEQEKLKVIDSVPVIRSQEFKDKNPVFPDFALEYTYPEGSEFVDQTIGRYSYGVLGKRCVPANGNFARITFEVLGSAPAGETTISFDDSFEDNIRILDCHTNSLTKEALPHSKKDAIIQITS
ncbi:MAG: cohesin domain-containing protein [archaeon]